jgi:hypothetical protein
MLFDLNLKIKFKIFHTDSIIENRRRTCEPMCLGRSGGSGKGDVSRVERNGWAELDIGVRYNWFY